MKLSGQKLWAVAVSLALHGGGAAWALGPGSAPGGSEGRRVDVQVPAPPIVVEAPEPSPEPRPEPKPECEPKVTPRHHASSPQAPKPGPPPPQAPAVRVAEAPSEAATRVTESQTLAADPSVKADVYGVLGGAPGGAAGGVAGGQGDGRRLGRDLPVVGPSYDAAYLNNAPPRYPAVARRMKLQGTSTVRVLVGTDGHPEQVRLEATSGVGVLDEAALEAVQGWRFVPARQGETAVAAEVNVPLRFRLQEL